MEMEPFRTVLAEFDRQQGELELELEERFRELELLHGELIELQRQVAQQRGELQACRAEALAGPPDADHDFSQLQGAFQTQLEEALQKVSQRDEQIDALRVERDELESELDVVRARAAELSDTLDQMKREAIEERAEWSAELKQMRRALERQSSVLMTSGAAVVSSVTEPTVPASHKPGGANGHAAPDPVLGSVVAQFEKIRRDRAQRRPRPVEETV
jgi:hypothetical protein